MEWLAEFMGWKEGKVLRFATSLKYWGGHSAWGFWLTEVEPRIRERELWGKYVANLLVVVLLSPPHHDHQLSEVDRMKSIMQATLEQRAEALKRVLEFRPPAGADGVLGEVE